MRPSLSAKIAPSWVLHVFAPSACVRAMTSWLVGDLTWYTELFFGYRPAVINLQSVLIFVPLSFDPSYLRLVLAAMLAFGLLLGSVGSYLGVRRFLKQ